MENKFKKGLFLGGVLAAAAALGFALSKQGRELSEELQKDFKILAKQVKKSLGKMEDVTREEYDGLVDTLVEDYAAKKEMAAEMKEDLIAALKEKWHEMEEEFFGDDNK